MLRVIRTELYFNPLEIQWRFPELVVSHPGISMAFFKCDPEHFDLGQIFSSLFLSFPEPQSLPAEPQLLRPFFDAALQNAPFHIHGRFGEELNPAIIDEIYQEGVIVEHSPPEAIPLGKAISGASVVTVGASLSDGRRD